MEMGLGKKTGIFLILCCMAAIVAVVWYCLLSVGQVPDRMDGTFVAVPAIEMKAEMAA
jgi:hypothetical protein